MTECNHRWGVIEGSWSKDGAHYSRRCIGCGHRERIDAAQFFDAMKQRAGGGSDA